MPFDSSERARWLAELAAILEAGPERVKRDDGGAKVCQGCGHLGGFQDETDWHAGHVEGYEFLAFSAGHECDRFPSIRSRAFRFCEVCADRVPTSAEHRFGHSWLCGGCAAAIEAREWDWEEILAELAWRRRGAAAGPAGGGYAVLTEPELPHGAQAAPAPPDWLPAGLYVCERCGTIRGATPAPRDTIWRSVCRCAGLPCRRCGGVRCRRPISDYFDPGKGGWWHVPYLAGLGFCCADCGATEGTH